MKVLIINETNNHGIDTQRVTFATTLKNAFRKASIYQWEYYRIYQVYSDRAPHIVFESVYPRDLKRSVEVRDISVKLEEYNATK